VKEFYVILVGHCLVDYTFRSGLVAIGALQGSNSDSFVLTNI